MATPGRSDPYSVRHLAQRAAHDADQAEFSAIIRQSSVLDSGIYDDRVAGVMDDFDPQDSTIKADWHLRDIELDSAVGKVHEEIDRRIEVMGDHYPFTIDGGQLTYRKSRSLFYEFCLSICNAPTITQGVYVELPRVFERSSARLVREYFGVYSEVLHTGWPRDEEVGVRFKEAMAHLQTKTGEWRWRPEDDLPEDPDPQIAKDEGLDFVVWKKSIDGRTGSLFVLGQCACGNDWKDKYFDLNLGRLRKWFSPMTIVDPIRSFATPHHVANALLTDAQREAGLVFDRARLTLIAERAEQPDVAAPTADLNRLVESVKDAA